MINELFQAVFSFINKDALGSIRPIDLNTFANIGVLQIYNNQLTDLKSNVRKSNWMLDGKNLADHSQHTQQLVEHYLEPITIESTTGKFQLPVEAEFIEEVYTQKGKQVDKKPYEDFKQLQNNIYAQPDECSPICSKLSRVLYIYPKSIGSIELNYLRKPNRAKWTFVEYQGKPMFDSTAKDYRDLDIPASQYPNLVSIVTEMAAKHLRDMPLVQVQNQDQAQEEQIRNEQ